MNEQLKNNIKTEIDLRKKDFNENFSIYLLEQYKLYIEMMDKVTERRGKANTFYTSLLSGLLALLSLITNKNNVLFFGDIDILILAFSVFGISLCYIWFISINSYKTLNKIKFQIIQEMECHLPFPCYDWEWKIDKVSREKYIRLTKVEKCVPGILSISYICLFFYSCYKLINL